VLPAIDARTAFERADVNKDGKLNREEFGTFVALGAQQLSAAAPTTIGGAAAYNGGGQPVSGQQAGFPVRPPTYCNVAITDNTVCSNVPTRVAPDASSRPQLVPASIPVPPQGARRQQRIRRFSVEPCAAYSDVSTI
jgi:hypothetical protein